MYICVCERERVRERSASAVRWAHGGKREEPLRIDTERHTVYMYTERHTDTQVDKHIPSLDAPARSGSCQSQHHKSRRCAFWWVVPLFM